MLFVVHLHYFLGRLYNSAATQQRFTEVFDEKLPQMLQQLAENRSGNTLVSIVLRYFFEGAPVHTICEVLEN